MKRVFSGPESGKGAIYSFEGNKEVGKGRLTITETTPSSKIVIALDFEEPFEGHNIVEYTLDARGGSTDVTWAMHGQQPYIGKVISLFIDCDTMIGKDFEVGLANLKALSETSLKASTS